MRVVMRGFRKTIMVTIASVFLVALLYPSLGFCLLMQSSPTYYLTVEKNIDQPTVILQEGETELVGYTVKVLFNTVAPTEGCYLPINKGQCVVISDTQNGELGSICYGDITANGYQEFSYSVTVGPISECGDFTFDNTVMMDYEVTPATSTPYTFCTDTVTLNVHVPCEQPGTASSGFWKNHPEAWPVETITIGCVEYSKDQAIAYMKAPVKGDKTLIMFRALAAAKLNALIGNDDSCIAETIAAADAWLCENHLAIGLKSGPWKIGEPLLWELNNYNNGYLCASARDELD